MRRFFVLLVAAAPLGLCAQPVDASSRADALSRADSLSREVVRLHGAGEAATALPLAREALALREAVLGPDHPDVGAALGNLGFLLQAEGDGVGARAAWERALGLYEVALGPGHPAATGVRERLVALLQDRGDYVALRPLFAQRLAVLEAALGPGHPDVAAALDELADVLNLLGDYAAAQLLYERALAVREAVLGPDHPAVAETLNGLAALHFERADPDAARLLLERALSIWEAAVGPDHPDVATVLVNLAASLWLQGEGAAARPLLDRALAIREAALGPDHPDVAASLDALAALLRDQGDHAEARPLFERSLAVREAALGPGHPAVAVSLNNLGRLLAEQGDRLAARGLYTRALAIREAALGPGHPDVATSLNNLADLHLADGDAEAAQDLYERAIAVSEAALGPDHPGVAVVLNNLGSLHSHGGDLDAARPLLERALAIWEAAHGPGHPDVAVALGNLALLRLRAGDVPGARTLFGRAGQILDGVVETVLPTLSPAEQRAFVDVDLMAQTSFLLSAAEGEVPDVYRLVGGWKGLLLRELRRQFAIDALADDSAYVGVIGRLRDLRARVADAVERGAPDLDALTREKEALQRMLAAVLPTGTVADPWRALGPGGLGAVLPEGAVFADLYWTARVGRGGFEHWRYSAVLTAAGAAPVFVDLGDAEGLDAALAAWREAVLNGRPADTAALAEALWGPLAAALPAGTDRVWIAPDDRLARVPWAVLAQAHGAEALVAEVASGRALARLLSRDAPASGDGVLLVGGVDFGPGGSFAPLPGTAAEIAALAPLADAAGLDARMLDGAAPTPGTVTEAMRGVAYVHLATHGYVYAESPEVAEARSVIRLRTDEEAPLPAEVRRAYTRNPLAESGLALAGANGDGGRLTAEELVGLDLAGTRLVVLSACDTGRGREVTGQGVLGLRASLDAAGAGALLLSLWPVADDATAFLMARFYQGLWADGLSPAEALRRAQAAVRAQEKWAAPRFWAAWTLSGDAFSPYRP